MSQINSLSSANIFSQIVFLGTKGDVEPSICTPELAKSDCRKKEASTLNFFKDVSENIADLEKLSADNFSAVDIVFFRILADDIILLEENIHPGAAAKKAEISFLANRLVKLYQRKNSHLDHSPSEESLVVQHQPIPSPPTNLHPTSQSKLQPDSSIQDQQADFSIEEETDSSGYLGISSTTAVKVEKVPSNWKAFLRKNRHYKASKFTELLRLKTKKIDAIIKDKNLLFEFSRLTIIWGVKELLLKRPIWKLKSTREAHEKSLFDKKDGLLQQLSPFEKFNLIRRCVHFLKGYYQKETIRKIFNLYRLQIDELTLEERQIISSCYRQESALFMSAGFETEDALINIAS